MAFITYDLIFLVVSILAVIWFLHKKRKNVKRQGLIYLYHSQLGIKSMEKYAGKYKKFLTGLEYVIIFVGVILMVDIVWELASISYAYVSSPFLAELIKAPPVAPLLPYFPKLFGLESFFPPLYFTYFIVAVAIGGVLHEFAHGVMMKLNKLKIKSTGFLFLGPLLGAFVEQDEEEMSQAGRRPQMAILAAGTFTNLVLALIFGAALWLFFIGTFAPAGIEFSGYATSEIGLDSAQIPEFSLDDEYVELVVDGGSHFVSPKSLQYALDNGVDRIVSYDSTPAFNSRLRGAIIEIGGQKIDSYDKLAEVIGSHSPGDEVMIKTAQRDGIFDSTPEFAEYDIEFADRDGRAFLGIGFAQSQAGLVRENIGIMGWYFGGFLLKIQDPLVYYESSLGEFGWFVYYLVWWVATINLLLALFNMLPVGPLDGGRFLQLGVASLTGSDKIGRGAMRFATWFILLILALLLGRWLFGLVF